MAYGLRSANLGIDAIPMGEPQRSLNQANQSDRAIAISESLCRAGLRQTLAPRVSDSKRRGTS